MPTGLGKEEGREIGKKERMGQSWLLVLEKKSLLKLEESI